MIVELLLDLDEVSYLPKKYPCRVMAGAPAYLLKHSGKNMGASSSALEWQPSFETKSTALAGLSHCGPGMRPSVENMESVLSHRTAQSLSTDGTTEQECDLWFCSLARTPLPDGRQESVYSLSRTGQTST